ncbi:hypothetical protein CLAFUW4_01341 [Fulvia fulva]|uniref:DUF7730 domain-containing protein n=1 Tax=Passalora fulva TaxID=5499 RepID=A0A9Q8L6K7_PASFU|nr:uncharacterized protein CLAFUR5_01346 [Fulvia fulva]KAK4635851.1 hypothetical protein CLAFUR4_01342 [Fulvia fulva]KAK4638283.1 hypothetical protein CLAFUR0_01343 [Fulvia fulva]UJO11800.1 hypothetical protein CLAFUR5_01346 [Fulvia fulva]WPV10058.1 hypothetical protein CLAFUW4_01341 [Fulvia fulva]WPV23150.1 hypothetical protein CLAFUW7_01346 [Fulvia fulva]
MARFAVPVQELKAQRRSSEHKVQRAHKKILQARASTSTPSLADRLYALPGELRNHIFAFLLVQPVKWDLEHNPDCPRRTSDEDLTPQIPGRNYVQPINCATSVGGYWRRWRRDTTHGMEPWTSPWRSQWAPVQRNPYICSTCYDDRVRPTFDPVPRARSLPCLCARRQNLQVLLVCRQWYEEGAYVFYTRNTFAFEDSGTFLAFSANVTPYWKRLITKLSLAAWILDDVPYESAADHLEPKAQLSPIWSTLRTYPSLSTLEQAGTFLNHHPSVDAMLKLGLRNLRRLCFVREPPKPKTPVWNWHRGTPTIWPQLAKRELVVGGFAEEVARAIKGQRQKRLKGPVGRCAKGSGLAETRDRRGVT